MEKNIESTEEVKIRLSKADKSTIVIRVLYAFLILITLSEIFGLDTGKSTMSEGLSLFWINVKRIFFSPSLVNKSFMQLFDSLLITLGLAFITTLMGFFVAIVLALLSTDYLVNNKVAAFVKGFNLFIRAVPTILWVLIFASLIGLGSEAAIIGLSFHSISYLAKAFNESFENIDRGILEALRASGASKMQIIFQAILPTTMGQIISWCFIRFEINFANAVVVGAATGAGGIGFDLIEASQWGFHYEEIGFIIYMIVATSICLELIANRLKKNYIK